MDNLIESKQMISTIVDITWERIFLKLDVRIDFSGDAGRKTPPDFYFVNGRYEGKAKARLLSVDGNVYHLCLNITNTGEKQCLPSGTYSLIVCQNGKIMAKSVVDRMLVPKMSDCSRNFLYAGRGKAYTVTFFVNEGEDDLPFCMYTMASAKVGTSFPSYEKKRHGITLNPLKKAKKWYHKNHRALKVKLYHHYLNKYSSKRNGKTVLFMSEQSEVLGTNEKAVMDRMVARGMESEYTILQSCRSSVSNPKMGYKSWLEMLKKLAMSDFVILDDHAPVFDWLKVDPETTVVQLWHAGAGFKSSGYSRWGHIGCPAPQSCHRQYKYGIAGSKSIAPFFSEVWGINDSRVLPTGMPRIDEYLDPDYRKEKTEALYQEYPLCKGKKVILFAPTYRGRNKADAHYPYELIDFDKLYQLCGEEYVVLFKMHPWVAAPVPLEEKQKDRFADVGRYPNINDLFYITDLLITDYSSNIFEYSLMRKPMLFFAFDEIPYSFSRGFHRNYRESAPGKVCETFEEVLEAIAKQDFEYQKVEEYVEKHFDYIDSNASDRVIDWIILGNIPEKIKEEIRIEDETAAGVHLLDFSSLSLTGGEGENGDSEE
ncbi:MAG: CDP-glycerol glycerophosphotransferase family protein [Clostridiaceae bacterium]|nr:CDP-glycerol glycerophosphotransferase family protein [Clostridiaceae bacterium]